MGENQATIPLEKICDVVTEWVNSVATLVQPEHIHWCDGSMEEKRIIESQMIARGELIKLNQETFPITGRMAFGHDTLCLRRGWRGLDHRFRRDFGAGRRIWMREDYAGADGHAPH